MAARCWHQRHQTVLDSLQDVQTYIIVNSRLFLCKFFEKKITVTIVHPILELHLQEVYIMV